VFLDDVDGGFTVFGRLISGTNVLNLFATPPTNFTRVKLNAYLNDYNEVISMDTLPVRSQVTNFYQLFTNIIYVDISLRRDLGLHTFTSPRGERELSWNSVAGVTNVVEYSEVANPLIWSDLATRLGTGEPMNVIDPAKDSERIYRVKLIY
jgi:hypothetical protein